MGTLIIRILLPPHWYFVPCLYAYSCCSCLLTERFICVRLSSFARTRARFASTLASGSGSVSCAGISGPAFAESKGSRYVYVSWLRRVSRPQRESTLFVEPLTDTGCTEESQFRLSSMFGPR